MYMIARFCDEIILAGKGILQAMKTMRFWVWAILSFVVFGTLINLLSAGFASFHLMAALGFPRCLGVLSDAFLGLFGINKAFSDWIVVFPVALLQGILIGMIAALRKLKKKEAGDDMQRAGIAAGLAVLGAGCPTCGTALLTPILGAVFAGGSAMVGTVSNIVTIIAVIIIIFSLKKVGEDYYVIMESNRYKKKKAEVKSNEMD